MIGGVIQWIISNSQRIAGWGMLLAAIAALAVAVNQSGVYESVANLVEDTTSLFTDNFSQYREDVGGFGDTIQSVADNDWVQLIFYCVALDYFNDILAFFGVNFSVLLAATLALFLALGSMFIAVFIYSRKHWLANAVAGGGLLGGG